jgi:hypothetical protein
LNHQRKSKQTAKNQATTSILIIALSTCPLKTEYIHMKKEREVLNLPLFNLVLIITYFYQACQYLLLKKFNSVLTVLELSTRPLPANNEAVAVHEKVQTRTRTFAVCDR